MPKNGTYILHQTLAQNLKQLDSEKETKISESNPLKKQFVLQLHEMLKKKGTIPKDSRTIATYLGEKIFNYTDLVFLPLKSEIEKSSVQEILENYQKWI